MNRYNIYDAKANLSSLVKRAEAGERITINRRGKPAAVLGPCVAAAPAKTASAGLTLADVTRASADETA